MMSKPVSERVEGVESVDAGDSTPNHSNRNIVRNRARPAMPRRSAHLEKVFASSRVLLGDRRWVDPTPAPRAAARVLTSSIAIVIGPTPPGTGVIAARDLAAGLEVDVADEPVVGAVRADVDHRGARTDHLGADQARLAGRGDEHLGPAADLRRGRRCGYGRR